MSAEVAAAPTVPESVLKKRKRDEQWALSRKEQQDASKIKNRENRKVIFKRADQYVKEYRQQVLSSRNFLATLAEL